MSQPVKMDFYMPADLPSGPGHLLEGCWIEAQRAEITSACVDSLRGFLPETYHAHMTALADEVRTTGRMLRDLVDRSQVHASRVPVVLSYLNVLLPCLSRSLRDMSSYYEDKALSKEMRWRTMYHKMTDEASGLPLPQRFTLYNHFLSLLGQLLARSPDFDMNALEVLQDRILQLREKRGIAPPTAQSGPLVSQAVVAAFHQDQNIHWAEDIFSRPLSSRTPLKHLKSSAAYGPWCELKIPPGSKILFRRPFDHDRLSIMVVISSVDDAPYVVVRSYHHGALYSSIKGVHELCISREDSAIVLKRWSRRDSCGKLWAVLYFITWEEMVLFHCSFVALKSLSELSCQLHPGEFKLEGEKRLFQARIIDDGFQHSLIVYRDQESRGIRLHAAVWDGELRQMPVWTAFVTHQCQSATWLSRKGKHRVWLTDVHLYVFCKNYRQEHMRQNKAGAFELYFVSDEAAQRFKEVFSPNNSPGSSEHNDSAPK